MGVMADDYLLQHAAVTFIAVTQVLARFGMFAQTMRLASLRCLVNFKV